MLKYLSVIFTGVIFSFYFFPFEFSFLPGINTKMGLAVVGIVIYLYQLIQQKGFLAAPNVSRIVVAATIVSLVAIISVVFNNTPDYAYATYLVSMMVWLSAAFTVCTLIRKVHGEISVEKFIKSSNYQSKN